MLTKQRMGFYFLNLIITSANYEKNSKVEGGGGGKNMYICKGKDMYIMYIFQDLRPIFDNCTV